MTTKMAYHHWETKMSSLTKDITDGWILTANTFTYHKETFVSPNLYFVAQY